MRGLAIISLSLLANFTIAYSCEVDPGCVIYPNGCGDSDQICCTAGWTQTCKCCVYSTQNPITKPYVTTTAVPPTVQSTTTISLTTSAGSITYSGVTESAVTVMTTQSAVIIPTAIVDRAFILIISLTAIFIAVISSIAVVFIKVHSFRTFVYTLLNRCFEVKRTPHITNLIDLEPSHERRISVISNNSNNEFTLFDLQSERTLRQAAEFIADRACSGMSAPSLAILPLVEEHAV